MPQSCLRRRLAPAFLKSNVVQTMKNQAPARCRDMAQHEEICIKSQTVYGGVVANLQQCTLNKCLFSV